MSQTMSQSAGVKPYEEGGDLHQHDAFVKSGNSVLWDVGLCTWRVGRVRRAVVRGPRGRASPSLARSGGFLFRPSTTVVSAHRDRAWVRHGHTL
jgi:hypothetical protein